MKSGTWAVPSLTGSWNRGSDNSIEGTDGLALAAIQGLNEKLEEKDAEIAALTQVRGMGKKEAVTKLGKPRKRKQRARKA